ncbi:MAG: winged helix-turn-helix domain-containing protein [Rubrivivax sp.]
MTADGNPQSDRYRCGRFELQPAARRLLVDGRQARVGARAFDLLMALAERPGRVVGKDELLASVWSGVVVEEANLAVQVSALRKVLGDGLIATVPGRGYQFTGRLEALAPAEAAPPPSAVPRAPAPMLGRAAELAAVSGMLAAQRLVTIAGPGGIGKTRLAQAWCEGPGAGEHVVWVDLAAVADAAGLPALLQARLDGASAAPTLVLDNAETIVAETAACVPPLLAARPRLRVLVTSQLPLRVQGEQVCRLGTLPVPPARATPAEALAHAAVQLFVERAREADPRFELAEGNVTSVIEICRRLDGLPLALELAAARVATIGVNALVAALGAALDAAGSGDGDGEQGLALLGEAGRDKPQRQRTLQAALEWSHALLDAPARRMFRRLGVFSGGFTLAAAQAVVAEPGDGAWDVMNTLGRLVEHSLVAKDGAEPPRFRLLDAARLFALAQLDRAQEGAALRRRHLAWCTSWAQGLAEAAHVDAEDANLRAALAHAFAPGSGLQAAGARLVQALQRHGAAAGADDEARRWSAQAAAASAAAGDAAGGGAPAEAPIDAGIDDAIAQAAAASARGEPAAGAQAIDAALAALAGREAQLLARAAAARRRLLEAGLQQARQDRDAALAAARIEALGALEDPAQPSASPRFGAELQALLDREADQFEHDLAARLLQRRFDATAADPAARHAAGLALLQALGRLADAGGRPHAEPLPLAEALLAETPREADPAAWSTLQHERARALGRQCVLAGDPALAHAAIAACRLALQARPRETAPLPWADSMALLALLEWQAGSFDTGTAHLQAAVEAGRASLAARPRAQQPLAWARAQATIGTALSAWAQRDGTTARHHEAVAAHRAALTEYAPERSPQRWAYTQCNLAIDLAAIGEADSGPVGLESLQAAVDAYRAALTVVTREGLPARWAAIQHNLGGALRLIGERETGTQSLREAALAFAAALEHHTRERAPHHWAAGQNDRALALLALGRREGRIEPVQQAVAALREALTERRRETSPFEWARTTSDLAEALLALGTMSNDAPTVRQAAEAADAAQGGLGGDSERAAATAARARDWLARRA